MPFTVLIFFMHVAMTPPTIYCISSTWYECNL
jgi:hypothetical protein